MKQVRFGFKVKLPFGLFPSAAIFVRRLSMLDVIKLEGRFEELKSTLIFVGLGDIANQIVFEVE